MKKLSEKFKEAQLYKPVKKYFELKGFQVKSEYPFYNRRIDVVASKNNTVLAIELKQNLTKKLLYQALDGELFADYTYVAIKSNPHKHSNLFAKFKTFGIGILLVKQMKIKVILKPRKQIPVWQKLHQKAIEYILHAKDIGIAGRPCLKGKGPAQHVWELIQKYRQQHPKATWKELYNKVPNHYISVGSMYNAMRSLKRRSRMTQKSKVSQSSKKFREEK